MVRAVIVNRALLPCATIWAVLLVWIEKTLEEGIFEVAGEAFEEAELPHAVSANAEMIDKAIGL